MKLLKRIGAMCDGSRELLTRALQLSCALALGAALLLIDAGPLSAENYPTYLLAKEMWTLPQAILLLGAIGSVFIEERQGQK